MGDEFRVGAGAQFMKVHALAFAFHGNPVGVNAIQNPVQRHRSEAGQSQAAWRRRSAAPAIVRKRLPAVAADPASPATFSTGPWKRAKSPSASRPQMPAHGVHRNRASRIVHFQAQLKPFHREGDHSARDRADHDGFRGNHERA